MTTVALTAGQAPDAEKVLADMHAALGGAAKVAAIKTVIAKGVSRRTTANGTVENDTELFLSLPDKFLIKSVVAGQGPMAVYRNAGFNGDGLIMATDAPPNLAAGMRTRLASSDRAPGAAGAEQTPEQAAAIRQRQLLNQKKEFARLTLALFGSSYAGFPLEFSYAGEAESADGTAHIIAAKGPDDFSAQLFVDTKTHRALMLVWSDPGAGPNAGRMIERRLYLADVKAVDGLSLPHTLRRSVDGRATEETTYPQLAINAKIDAKIFEVSK